MCGKNKNCGCNSNFDGHNDLEELENSRYLDFDGEDSIDEDFDDFFGAKAKERRATRKSNRLEKRGITLHLQVMHQPIKKIVLNFTKIRV
jgi:hypothetical protein